MVSAQVEVAGGVGDEAQEARTVDAVERVDVVELGKGDLARHAPDHSGVESYLHTGSETASRAARLQSLKRLIGGVGLAVSKGRAKAALKSAGIGYSSQLI